MRTVAAFAFVLAMTGCSSRPLHGPFGTHLALEMPSRVDTWTAGDASKIEMLHGVIASSSFSDEGRKLGLMAFADHAAHDPAGTAAGIVWHDGDSSCFHWSGSVEFRQLDSGWSFDFSAACQTDPVLILSGTLEHFDPVY